jgi:hypothetical protein
MINKNTRIDCLYSLNILLRMKLVRLHFDTLNDILKYNVEELLKLDGITTFDVACLIELLNKYNYHLEEEHLLNISYFHDEKITPILKYCDHLIEKRNNLKKENNELYLEEEQNLSNIINVLLNQAYEIKYKENLKR